MIKLTDFLMENLISEAKGAMDYDLLINDIINQIYMDPAVYAAFEAYINRGKRYVSTKNGYDLEDANGNVYTLGDIDLNVTINSQNKPSWLKELTVEVSDKLGDAFAGVPVNEIDVDEENCLVNSATIYINGKKFFEEMFSGDNMISMFTNDDFTLRKITQSEYQNKFFNHITKKHYRTTELFDKIKINLSHEIKHIFDFMIAKCNNTDMLDEFNAEEFELTGNESTKVKRIVELAKCAQYTLNKVELSAKQQELIQAIKLGKLDRYELNRYLSEINDAKISTFKFVDAYETPFDNVFDTLYTVSVMHNYIYSFDMYASEIADIFNKTGLSKVVIKSDLKAKTIGDIKKFLQKTFDLAITSYQDIIRKAAKHL
jgi:hypothetical protein